MTTRRSLLLVALVIAAPRVAAAASCGADCVRRMAECRAASCADLAPKACRDRCRALTGCRAGGPRIRTLASVVTRCRVAGGQWAGEQRLEIKRGDCAPTTVVEFASTTVPYYVDALPLCYFFGAFRGGSVSSTVAPLQRLGMSPDGETVLFEVSTANVSFPLMPTFEVPEQGIFAVRADGSHRRRLGPPSREKPFKGPMGFDKYPHPPGFNIAGGGYFNFSPDGRFVVFADRAAGSDGTEAGQLVVMDVRSGDRTQVTFFTASMQDPPAGGDVYGWFIDADTISGVTLRVNADYTTYDSGQFLVGRDGRDFRYFVPPTVPGRQQVENFRVAGRERRPRPRCRHVRSLILVPRPRSGRARAPNWFSSRTWVGATRWAVT
jgi:hypothetical protein